MVSITKSVTLVGCGNIGFRHLQALAAMNEPAEIIIVEPSEAAHSRIEGLIVEVEESERLQPRHTFRIVSSLAVLSPGETNLVVIAADARHRRSAWEELRARVRPRAVIFEKVPFPTLADIEAVAKDLREEGTAGFVNCGRRGFPDYQSLARRFGGAGKVVDVIVEGARFGLGSNAGHFLDLAEMLNGAELVSLSADGLDAGSHPSKRPGYIEISGTLEGKLSNGATVSIRCEDKDPVAVRVGLVSHDGSRIDIDEFAATVRENNEQTPFSIRHVSQMSELYETLLTDRGCVLTPYSDSARQHRFYLQALRGHLGLSNAKDDPCPVS